MARSGFQVLASLVANAEGKKTQARIGEVREILKILRKLYELSPEFLAPILAPVKSKKR